MDDTEPVYVIPTDRIGWLARPIWDRRRMGCWGCSPLGMCCMLLLVCTGAHARVGRGVPMPLHPPRAHSGSSIAAGGEAAGEQPTEGGRVEGQAAAAAEAEESRTSGVSSGPRRQLHSAKRSTHVATLSANFTDAVAATDVLRVVYNTQPTDEPVIELTTVAADDDRAVVHTRVAASAAGDAGACALREVQSRFDGSCGGSISHTHWHRGWAWHIADVAHERGKGVRRKA